LDHDQQGHEKHSSFNAELKQEGIKPEIKLKEEEQDNYMHFTICSFEYLFYVFDKTGNFPISTKEFNGLIIDEPRASGEWGLLNGPTSAGGQGSFPALMKKLNTI
jgi:hypothetical protein